MRKTVTIANHFLFIIFLITTSGKLSAQQDPLFSQYMFTNLSVNPAYAGSGEGVNAALLYRKQWVGLQGGPSVQLFTIHAPVDYRRIGLGLQLLNESQAIYKRTSASVSYSYKVNVKEGILSMGISGGIVQSRVDYSSLTIKDPDEVQGSFNKTRPDFGFGLYYQKKNYYAGFSVSHLMDFQGKAIKNMGYVRHYYLTGAYNIRLSERIIMVPSVLVKYATGAPIQADLTMHLKYKGMLWTGLSCRTGDAISLQAGASLSRLFNQSLYDLKIGYAYDATVSGLRNYNRGTHELMVLIDFELLKSTRKLNKKKVTVSPLFL